MLDLVITVNHRNGTEEYDLTVKCPTFHALPAAVSAALKADPVVAANKSEISSLVIVAVPIDGVTPFHEEAPCEVAGKAAVYMSMDDAAMTTAAATGDPEQLKRRAEFFAGVRSIAAAVVCPEAAKVPG